jgi:hypothetical protein
MNNGKYLVIVYPPKPATRDVRSAGMGGSVSVADPPRVCEVDARFPADAAEAANVQPGGHCVVITDAARFDRAPQAPLEAKALDGNPLPAEATA